MAQEVASVYGKIGCDLSGWNSGLKKMQGGVATASQSLKSMGTGAMKVGGIASAAITAPIVAGTTKMFAMAGEFEAAMNILEVSASSSKTSLDELRTAAIAVGADTSLVGVNAADTTLAMDGLYKAGLSTAQIFGDLDGYLAGTAELGGALRASIDLAAASELDLAAAQDVVTVAMSTYGIGAEEATKITDSFVRAADASVSSVPELAQSLQAVGPIAAGMNISLDDTNTALAVLSQRGIAGATAGTQLKSMYMAMSAPSQKALDLMNELNVSWYDAEGALKPLPQQFSELQDAMAGLPQKEVDEYMKTLFGTYGGVAARVFFDEGVEGWNKMEGAIDGAASTQVAAGARTKGLSAAWENLQGVIETVILQGTSPFMESVTGIVSKLADLISGLSEMDPIWFKVAGGIALALAAAGPIVTAFGAIATVLGFLISPVGLIVAGLVALGAAFVKSQGGIKPAIARIKEFGAQLLKRIGPAIEKVKGIVDTVKNKGLLGALFSEKTLETIKQLWAILSGGAQRALGVLRGIVADVVPFVSALLSNMAIFFSEQFGVVIEWVRANLPLIQQTITTVLDKIQSIWTTVWPYLQQVITIVWNMIKTYISGAIQVIGGIIKAVMQVINGDWAGAWETIKGALATAWETIKSVVMTAINGILGLLGTDMDTLKTDMATKWDEIKTNIATKWEEFKTTIATKLTEIKTNALTKWGEIKEDIATKLGEIATDIQTKWEEFKTTIATKLTEIKTSVATKWGEVKTAISEKLEEIKTLISEKMTEAKDAIVEKVSDFIQAGKDLIQGVIDGITEKAEAIKTAAKTAAMDALNAAKSALGIHSPSTEFWEIGKQMMAGWAQGIDKNESDVIESLANAISDITDAFAEIFNITQDVGSPGAMPDLGPWVDNLDAMFMQVAEKLMNIEDRVGYDRIKKIRHVAQRLGDILQAVQVDLSNLEEVKPVDLTQKFAFLESAFESVAWMLVRIKDKWGTKAVDAMAAMAGSVQTLIGMVNQDMTVGEVGENFAAELVTWADAMELGTDEMITRMQALETKWGGTVIAAMASIAENVKKMLALLGIDLNITPIEDGWLGTFMAWLDTFDAAVAEMISRLQALQTTFGADLVAELADYANGLQTLWGNLAGGVQSLRDMIEGGDIDTAKLTSLMGSVDAASAAVANGGAEAASGASGGAGSKTLKIILDATGLGGGVKELTARLDNLEGQLEDMYIDLALDGGTP